MINSEKNTRLAELERKWLDGSISKEEAAEYDEWYKQGLESPVDVPFEIASDKEEHRKKIFNKITHKLHWSATGEKATVIPMRFPAWGKYAAIVALLLTIGTLSYLFLFSPAKHIHVLANGDIAPGGKNLKLEMENGNSFILQDMHEGVISKKGQLNIVKRNNMLRYEGRGDSSFFNTAVTDIGQQYQIRLSDGTMVWLNSSSSLKFPLGFGKKARVVELDGEAYFEVAHNAKLPFIVMTENQKITVLGTHFNICAYAESLQTSTTLLEGSVAVESKSGNCILKPGEKSVTGTTLSRMQVQNADTASSIAWKYGKFSFNNMSVESIMKHVQRWYGVDVVFDDKCDRKAVFYGSTSMNQNLSEVIKVLDITGIHCNYKNKTIYVLP